MQGIWPNVTSWTHTHTHTTHTPQSYMYKVLAQRSFS